MEHFYALTGGKEEIRLDIIRYHKEDKRKSKPRKKLIRNVLLIAITLTASLAIAFNFSNVKEFFSKIFSLAADAPASESSEILTNADTESDKAYTYQFKQTQVEQLEICNETDFHINFDDKISFPTKSEICSSYGANAPVVLIVSMSPKEAYAKGEGYNSVNEFYSDKNNVASIGAEICARLNELGLPALQIIHDADDTIYGNSTAYKEAINKTLKDNPSIAYVIDISRSLDMHPDNSISLSKGTIDGKEFPAISLWCGTSGEQLEDSRLKSILFANQLANSATDEEKVIFGRQTISRYTLLQEFDAICFRADIGSFACRYEEAQKSALLFADILAKMINT